MVLALRASDRPTPSTNYISRMRTMLSFAGDVCCQSAKRFPIELDVTENARLGVKQRRFNAKNHFYPVANTGTESWAQRLCTAGNAKPASCSKRSNTGDADLS